MVASSYLSDSASTSVKGASNIGPRGLISYIPARITCSIKAKSVVTCVPRMSDSPGVLVLKSEWSMN